MELPGERRPATGAECVIQVLRENGISRVFTFPGGAIAAVFDAAIRGNIEIITARHEQGAGYAALAAARLTGEPQVVLVTSGPGVTNLVTTIADAYFDSVPVVAICGQVATGELAVGDPVRQRGFQEVDTLALMAPVAKECIQPSTPDQVAEALRRAFRIAADGRAGPVVIDLPMDVQFGEITVGLVEPAAPRPEPLLRPMAADIMLVRKMLERAERPVIIAGAGVRSARAEVLLRQLAQTCRIPVSQTLASLGVFPTDSALALGFHGYAGTRYSALAIHHSDVLLVLGSRLDVRQTGTVVDRFAPEAQIVRIDSDQAELDYSRCRSDVSIQCDAGAFLQDLMDGWRSDDVSTAEWLARIGGWKAKYGLSVGSGDLIKPQSVVECVDQITANREIICVTGVGAHQQWVARHFTLDSPQRSWLSSTGHGAMGFDLPAAVGAKLTRPRAEVVCFVGDGSFQINMQELGIIAERGIGVKIVVLDNRRLGIVSQFQRMNWGFDPTCGNRWNPDFAAIARCYGLTGLRIERPAEVEPALASLFDEPGPALAHVLVDPEEDVVPMLLGGDTMDRMWPYIEDEE